MKKIKITYIYIYIYIYICWGMTRALGSMLRMPKKRPPEAHQGMLKRRKWCFSFRWANTMKHDNDVHDKDV